ncbi:MAG: HD domain-containing protein [Curvibacter lanceolatus]|jgi:(p)ppGpp synthase/HD superfamily hydrolase|uniref:HD domain-containing protein n=1 Tax=Curvibacter lanceolatus TaxID=86182 RepID=UPI00035F915C|nr:HD domain-containing protein [Curvibacter lanceolatus]MBV5293529.1 HD domain-containing protein [Curvibacter lanceolatus]
MTPRFTQALTLASTAHEGQVRKGTTIPYITHPVVVAGLVAQYGGDEDQQVAALLHDVLEDGGPHYAQQIGDQFGARVLAIVQACSDGQGQDPARKLTWTERKRAYLAHLRRAPDEALLVSGCDKLSNARAILDDLVTIGPSVFDRFNAKLEGAVWYYEALSQLFTDRKIPMAKALADTLQKIRRLVPAS